MSKKLKILLVAMLVLTCAVAVFHRNSQETVSCMVIKTPEKEIAVDFSDLDQEAFSGELVNGKGDVTFHSYTGILLRDLLEAKGIHAEDFSVFTVTSADNYTASYTAQEILETESVYAAVTADGKPVAGIDAGTDGVQIIVFGDPDSKRCVRYAVMIECT